MPAFSEMPGLKKTTTPKETIILANIVLQFIILFLPKVYLPKILLSPHIRELIGKAPLAHLEVLEAEFQCG